jgi:ABC-type sugar transport system permease subunit
MCSALVLPGLRWSVQSVHSGVPTQGDSAGGTVTSSSGPPRGTTARLVGWLLLLPAVALGIWQRVVPAVRTVWVSFFGVRLGCRRGGGFIGLEAYVAPAGERFSLANSFLFLPAVAVAGLLGLAAGLLLAHGATATRLVARSPVGAMAVLYAPIGVGLG